MPTSSANPASHIPVVRAVLQARMGSTRFPGKVLVPLAGQPLMEHAVNRMIATGRHLATSYGPVRFELLVATTTLRQDDVVEEYCLERGLNCFRGDAEDVLARYLAATADMANNDTIVRPTADNPLYCPKRVAKAIAVHLTNGNDYTCIRYLSYVVPEVFRVGALREMAPTATSKACREHVTWAFREPESPFQVEQLPHDWEGLQADIPLTVDTPPQWRRMQAILARFPHRRPSTIPLEAVYSVCREIDARKHGRHAAPRPHRLGVLQGTR